MTNPGDTTWYNGSFYQLVQKSNLSLSPNYGHISEILYPFGGVLSSTFTLTAPTEPGNYTLEMQMVHKAGAPKIFSSDVTQSFYIVNGSISSSDTYFGQVGTVNFVVQPETGPCAITSFTATDTTLPENNTGATLRFSLSDSFPWNISLVRGTKLPAPYSGTETSERISLTGNLTTTQTYRLHCGDAIRDVTVSVSLPGGGTPNNTCQDIDANNYGGTLPCQFPIAAVCENPLASNNGQPLPCIVPANNDILTPTITGPRCSNGNYDVQISWPTVNNNIRIFLNTESDHPGWGFDKVLNGSGGSTPAPNGFTQRLPPDSGAPQTLIFQPGIRYSSFIQNNRPGYDQDGPTVSWVINRCAPPAASATGVLDAANCSSIGGWAWDPDFPNDPSLVSIYKDNTLYDTIEASNLRGDLPGNHKHSFTVSTPEAWKDGQDHTINVYALDLNGDGRQELTRSPKTINCPVTPAPNLTAGPVSPAFATVNTPVSFSATISNVGGASTIRSFANLFQIASAPNGSGTITDYPTNPMSVLDRGRDAVTTKSLSFNEVKIYSVRVCADKSSSGSSGVINNESNPNDNCGPWTDVTVTGGSDICLNGATNPPTCTIIDNPPRCLNGATNPPLCTIDIPPDICLNGATNPPLCTVGGQPPRCLNGATNPPTCTIIDNPPRC
ncbi:MAG: hypothetical protein AAB661_01680, partial [Patescibacteria group bacterium]